MDDQIDKTPDQAPDDPSDTPIVPARHGMAARVTAIGFIILIILGNVWVAQAITGAPLPGWFTWVSRLGLVLVFLGGTVMAVQFVKRYFNYE